MPPDDPRSYQALLDAMAAGENGAWDRFFQLYYPMVVAWARQFGCPGGMEDDVFQEVVLALFQQMENIKYDPSRGSFRAFLKTVTRHKVYDIYRRRREYQGDEPLDGSANWEDTISDTVVVAPGTQMDQVSIRVALHTALRAARAQVTPKTAQMFELYRIHDQPPEAVAAKLAVSVQVVYEATRRFRSEYLAPAFLTVMRELDVAVSEAVSARMLDKALDDLVRGQAQFEVTAESPSLRARVRYLQRTLDLTQAPQEASSWLQVINAPDGPGPKAGDQLSLFGDQVVIGRLDGLDLSLPSPHVSGRHATLTRQTAGWYIRDDESRNGTYVNRDRLTGPRALTVGDIVQIGDYSLVYLTRLPSATIERLQRYREDDGLT